MVEDDNDDQTPGPRPLSDEVVEQTKKEILSGAGYRRPPREHQFKKGKSGNPKGRPKNSALPPSDRSANALALKEADRLIAIREDGETHRITAIDAVQRAQYVSALKGSAYSQKHIIERYDRAEREQRQEKRDRTEFWSANIDASHKLLAEAKRKGEEAPLLFPHPDDVVIDEESGVLFIGPVDAEELKSLEETCRLRDLLIAQDALDGRASAGDAHGSALLLALVLNQNIPARFRLSDAEFSMRMLRHRGTPKRQLTKMLFREWRSLGAQVPRGAAFPPLHVGRECLEIVMEGIFGSAAGG